MKPHPRIRKTVKWGGTAFSVLLVPWVATSFQGGVTWDEVAFRWVPVTVWNKVGFWVSAAFVFAVTAFAWRLDTVARSRAHLNLCPNCSYDRTGIAADATCPECGAKPIKA